MDQRCRRWELPRLQKGEAPARTVSHSGWPRWHRGSKTPFPHAFRQLPSVCRSSCPWCDIGSAFRKAIVQEQEHSGAPGWHWAGKISLPRTYRQPPPAPRNGQPRYGIESTFEKQSHESRNAKCHPVSDFTPRSHAGGKDDVFHSIFALSTGTIQERHVSFCIFRHCSEQTGCGKINERIARNEPRGRSFAKREPEGPSAPGLWLRHGVGQIGLPHRNVSRGPVPSYIK